MGGSDGIDVGVADGARVGTAVGLNDGRGEGNKQGVPRLLFRYTMAVPLSMCFRTFLKLLGTSSQRELWSSRRKEVSCSHFPNSDGKGPKNELPLKYTRVLKFVMFPSSVGKAVHRVSSALHAASPICCVNILFSKCTSRDNIENLPSSDGNCPDKYIPFRRRLYSIFPSFPICVGSDFDR